MFITVNPSWQINTLERFEFMKRSNIKTLYRCKSSGPQNNGLLAQCDFQFAFEQGITPHCPQCGEKLTLKEDERSVSRLLREGFLKERQNKNV